MSDQNPEGNILQRTNQRIRQMTSAARWWTAIIVGAILVGAVLMCAVPGLIMATFATDACNSLPDWMGSFAFAPGAIAIGAIVISALMFGTRQRFQWVITVLFGGLLLGLCAFVAWFPLIAAQC